MRCSARIVHKPCWSCSSARSRPPARVARSSRARSPRAFSWTTRPRSFAAVFASPLNAERLHGAELSVSGPVVHRLVAVHVLAVAQSHLAEGVPSVQTLVVVEAVEEVALPRRTVPQRDASAFDDLQQAVARSGVDSPLAETLR